MQTSNGDCYELGAQSTASILAALAGCTEQEVASALGDGLRGLATGDGIGPKPVFRRAQRALRAALELSRRFARESSVQLQIQNPVEVFDFLQPRLVGLEHEQMHVLCLSSRQKLLRHLCVAQGFVDQCAVDGREIWAPALACRAAAIVLAHNHPSQDPEPSVQDVSLTQQLCQAGNALGIALLDHVIVTDRGFVSLRARGLFQALTAPHQKWNTRRQC